MTYNSKLSLFETQKAIKKLKDFFEIQLAYELNLTRVSAPLFVKPETGLNDNLTGIEKPVSFEIFKSQSVEIVQSLAKWKRAALKNYQVEVGEGIYTDMNAIRKDEVVDAIHSVYVDQWDWEKVINKKERNEATLIKTIKQIYKVFLMTDEYITREFPQLQKKLPDELFIISSQALEDMYPNLSPKERENAICRKHRAVFIKQIGHNLSSGKKHDDRSPDYDDWQLNGDLLLYNPILDEALELSSMGVRVDGETLLNQLTLTNTLERLEQDYHQAIMNNELPYSIGGGIGQSRLCLFFLEKAHIGEVQCSIWPKQMIEECKLKQIHLL